MRSPLGHRRGDLGDGAHLGREVRRQQIDVAGQILPGAGGTRHVRLAAEAPFDADLARDRRHLVGEGGERVGHVVDGVGQRRHLAHGFHRQVLFEIAVGDRGHDLDDAAHLFGQVRGHDVDRVGQILPGAGHTGHLRLAAELALGTDLARHARHFAGKRVQLIHHRVDGVLQLQDLTGDGDGDLAREIAARDGRGHFGDVAHLGREVRRQQIDVVGQILPGAADTRHDRLAAEAPLGADLAAPRASLRPRTSAAARPWCSRFP